jgi:hypothetical protein
MNILKDFSQGKQYFLNRRDPELASLLYIYYDRNGDSESFIEWIIKDDIADSSKTHF